MLSVNIKSVSRKETDKDTEVISNIVFSIEPGKIYIILGKNGSGKTTLIKSLTKLLDTNVFSTTGTVLWNSENILLMDEYRLQLIRQTEFRYVLQDLTNNFDPLKQIKYYFENTGLDKNTLSDMLKSFLLPEYNIISKLYPYEISGGMAQRLSLMFAFLPKPKLVILDEPTSAIDYTNINLIKIKLEEFARQNNSALIVTQDIQFAKYISDEIAFLNDGKLSEFCSTDNFFNASNTEYTSFIEACDRLK